MSIFRGVGGTGASNDSATLDEFTVIRDEVDADRIATQTAAAAAAADLVATNQDTIDTAADLVLTKADVVLTHADVVLAEADKVQTGLDRTAVAADLVATNQDTIDTAADLVATNQDTIDTAADLVATNQDTIDTAADVVLTHADVVLAEADKVQTGADRTAVAADLVATNQDTLDTAADVVLTNADVVLTHADVLLTHADVVLTHADVTTTANKLPLAGGAMTGAITTNSTFDGRDVATDGAKLDGIEAGADVTDTTNVTAAGAAMLTGADFTGDITTTGTVTSTDFIGPLNGPVQFTGKNSSGGTITKGQAIYISGISGNTPEVDLADANNASAMPAFGLAGTTAGNNNTLEVVTFGSLKGIQTDYSGWALGDTLYISNTAGVLTNVPPTGEASKIQNIGTVERLHSSNGTIKVGGAGRTNATPNLDDGNVFIGNASNQSAARALVIADTTGLQTALDAKAALAGAAFTGAITTNSTFDGRDVAADGATADAALPKAGGAMSGTITNFASTGIDDNSTSTAITIDSAESVGIGVTPETWNGFAGVLQVGGRGAVSSGSDTEYSNNSYYNSGYKYIATAAASQYAQTAGKHVFNVAASGSAAAAISWATAMTMRNDGGIGKDASFTSGADDWEIHAIGAQLSLSRSGTTSKNQIVFYNGNGNVGAITTSGSATTYATSSDYRLKENVTPMLDATAQTKLLKPCNFDWIVGGNVNGFIAHELAAVVPEAVTGTKDAMRDEEYEVTPAVYEDVVTPAVEAVEATFDDEGLELTPAVEAQEETTESVVKTEAVMGTRSVPDMQGIDQSKIVPLLTAALQEAIAKIESLETRLTALEGA